MGGHEMEKKMTRITRCVTIGVRVFGFLFLVAAVGCHSQNNEPVTLKNLDQVIDGLESSFTFIKYESLNRLLKAPRTDLVSFQSNPRFKRVLTGLLKDQNDVIQLFSASVLASTGEFSKELRDFYLYKLKSDNYWVRTQVCSGVSKNKEILKRSEDIMEKALKDEHWSVAQQAAFSLADHNDLDNEAIIDLLIARSKDDFYPIIQKYCMISLRNVKEKHIDYVLKNAYEIKDEIQKKKDKDGDLIRETKTTIESLEKRVKNNQ